MVFAKYCWVCVYLFVYDRIVCYFQYDINGDGVLEFLLSTSDAEILFVQTDNTLLHGETIKVRLRAPPRLVDAPLMFPNMERIEIIITSLIETN